MHCEEVDDTQRKGVLESHILLKQNRDGKIKGQTVFSRNNRETIYQGNTWYQQL